MTTPVVVNEKFELDSPSSFNDEKKDYADKETDSQVIVDYEPRHTVMEETQFTWRASIVGSLLGCLVGTNQ